MASETFSPTFSLHPDFQGAADWSGGFVPGGGSAAVINATEAWVEPLANIAANVTLQGGAALIGNQSGFLLSGTLLASDSDALYANGAIVNQGAISLSGNIASLEIVVQAGGDIAADYGLTIASFENKAAIDIADDAALNICGTEFSNPGTVFINHAALSVTGGWVDGGQGAFTPGGIIALSNGALASFNEGVTDQTFDFAGPGTIIFADPLDIHNVAVANFGYRDAIITNSVSAANALLNHSLFFTTALPPGETFAVQATSFGAEISLAHEANFPCFAAGTAILTPTGYVPVELLEPGDLILTASHAVQPIRWIGWRGIELARHKRPDAVYPVHITAGALAPFMPVRDLLLSPDHGVFLHGHLVPAKLLVNGATIRRDTACKSITYFHIELDRHDIIIAENLAVETYLDTGNRNAFANSHGSPHATPVFGRGRQWNHFACADLCLAGPILKKIRRELFNRTTAFGYYIETDFHIALYHQNKLIAGHDSPAHAVDFSIPAGITGPIAIRSASFIPAELSDGSAPQEDWRRLGIAISRIRLDHHMTSLGNIARHGVHPRGHGDEAEWTDGEAVIELPPNIKSITLALQAFPKSWVVPSPSSSPGLPR